MPFTTTLDQFLICLAKHFPLPSSKYFLPFKLRTKHLIWTGTCCCFQVCLLSMLLLYNSSINKKLIQNFWINVLGECIRYCILSFYVVDKKTDCENSIMSEFTVFLKQYAKVFDAFSGYFTIPWGEATLVGNDNMANIVSIRIRFRQNIYYIEHTCGKVITC